MAGSYRPSPAHYYQLAEPHTGRYDCTAYVAAWLADFETSGATKLTGRAVRLASTEPIPDPASPGLSLSQVDAAVLKLTHQSVNLQLGGTFRARTKAATAQAWATAGRPVEIQVNRASLFPAVPALRAVSTFPGSHAMGLFVDEGKPMLMEPLSRQRYFPAPWSAIWKACGDLSTGPGARVGQGDAFILAARDVVPMRYEVDIDTGRTFSAYKVVDGTIVGHRSASVPRNTSRKCGRRQRYHYPVQKSDRTVVELLEGALAQTDYRWVSVDAPNIHYREI